MNSKFFRSFPPVIVYLLTGFILLSGCGGGSSSNHNDPATLSKFTARPGEFLAIEDPSIQAGDAVSISFDGANGFAFSIVSHETAAGAAYFAVPVFIDTSALGLHHGAFSSGEINVSIEGKRIERPLLIESPIPISPVPSGFILQQLLRAAQDEYVLAKQELAVIAADHYDVQPMLDAIDQRVAETGAIVNQLDLLQGGTLGTISIGNQELTAQDLAYLDQMLADSMIGVADYLSTVANRTTVKSSATGHRISETDCYDAVNGDTSSIAYQNCIQVVRSIEHVIAETRRGVKGAGALLASVTVGVAVWGQASAGWAATEVASAAGLALAQIKATLDVGLSSLSNKISNAFNENDRTRIDEGKNLVKNAIDVGVQMFSALPGKVSEFIGWVSTATTVVDGVNDLEEVKCTATTGSPRIAFRDYAFSELEFCADYNPDTQAPLSLLIADVVFDGPDYAPASFSLIETGVIFLGTVTANDETRFGYPSLYAEGDDGSHFLLMLNKDTVSAPGTYQVTSDDIVWDENGHVTLFVDTPVIRDEDSDTPVGFDQYAGQLLVEEYGNADDERLKGTFSIDISAEKIICLNADCGGADDYMLETITGHVSGMFDGVVKEEPPQL